MRFRFIKTHRHTWPITVMCHVLRVSRSGYYAWQHRKASVRKQRSEQLLTKIRLIHKQSRQTYGSPRVHASLVCQGQERKRRNEKGTFYLFWKTKGVRRQKVSGTVFSCF